MKKLGLLLLLGIVAIGGVALYQGRKDSRPAQDEAKLSGKTTADFPESAADYFKAMDNGIALDENQVKGRNTWMIWTGGNEAFWDYLANHSFGTFDLLKIAGSYPCGSGSREAAPGYPSTDKSADPAAAAAGSPRGRIPRARRGRSWGRRPRGSRRNGD